MLMLEGGRFFVLTVSKGVLKGNVCVLYVRTVSRVSLLEEGVFVVDICLELTRDASGVGHEAELVLTDVFGLDEVWFSSGRAIHGEFVQGFIGA